jgi:hypothetical protein
MRKDYQSFFNRVSLDLGKSTPELAAMPTDKRLAAFQGDKKFPASRRSRGIPVSRN